MNYLKQAIVPVSIKPTYLKKLNLQKISYLQTCLKKRFLFKGNECPSCGSKTSQTLDQKFVITSLKRCNNCMLQYRTPTTSSEENARFYQSEYEQGFTTEMPDNKTLSKLKKTGFSGTEKDYSRYISLLMKYEVNPKAHILDFGCSWGYGSWQFQKAGFQVTATEISDPRRTYAIEKLGITTYRDLRHLPPGINYDVFFSAHVLEHVPNPTEIIKNGMMVLKKGGIFIAITPNGSETWRKKNPESWHKLWGMVHPNFLDEKYYLNHYPKAEIIGLEDYELIVFIQK